MTSTSVGLMGQDGQLLLWHLLALFLSWLTDKLLDLAWMYFSLVTVNNVKCNK
jgi:hypothetical protein